eukprot:c21524_g1_i2 orf=623-922(+)
MLLQVAELQARFERERAINKALQRSLGKVPADQPRNVTPTLKDVTPKVKQDKVQSLRVGNELFPICAASLLPRAPLDSSRKKRIVFTFNRTTIAAGVHT